MTSNPLVDALEQAYQRARLLDEPLNVRLKVITDEVRALSIAFAQTVDSFVARLEKASAGESAPQIGDVMPPFVLPDEAGRLVNLEDLLKTAPVAVAFHRGHWCPYCRLAVGAMAEIQDQFKPVQIVAISAETQQFSNVLKAEAGARFPLLTDFGNGYALSLNLAIWVSEEMSGLMAGAGWDVTVYQNEHSWVLPIPAVFVVGQDGCIKARHVDPDYRRRMQIEDLLEAVQTLL